MWCAATAASHGVLGSPLAGVSTGGQAERRQGLGPCSPSRCVGAHTWVSGVGAAPLCRSRVERGVRHKQQKCSVRVTLLPLRHLELVFASGRQLHRRSGREATGTRPSLVLLMRGSTHMGEWCALTRDYGDDIAGMVMEICAVAFCPKLIR